MQKWLQKIKNHFVPHDGNDFQPHLLRHQSTTFFLLLIILVELALVVRVFILPANQNFLASVLPSVLTEMTNAERAQSGLVTLAENPLLVKAAQMKAEDMVLHGYFAHTTPDGKTPWYWLEEVEYDYRYAGENLAVNFFESEQVARAWMNSASHRANIIKPEYREIGIAVASGLYQGQSSVFVVQFFGTQKEKPVITEVAPEPEVREVAQVASTAPKTSNTAPEIIQKEASKVAAKEETSLPETPARDTQVLGEEVVSSVPSTVSAPQSIEPTLRERNFWQKVFDAPFTSVTYALVFFSVLFIILLSIGVFVRSERHHPLAMLRGVGLLVFIIFLLFVNIELVHLSAVAPLDSASSFTEIIS